MDMRSGADRRSGGRLRVGTVAGVRLSQRQRVAAIGGIAGIVLLLGLLTYAGLTSIGTARASVSRTHRAIEATQAVLQDLTDAETGERGFLITGDERYLQPYQAALGRLAADTVVLRSFTSVDAAEQRELSALSLAIRGKVEELAMTIALMRTEGSEAARIEVDTHLGKRRMDEIRAMLRQIAARQQTQLDKQIEQSDRYNLIVETIVVVGTTAAILIALMLNTLLTKFGDAQADAARLLEAHNSELNDANRKLGEQTLELELQNQQLQEQTVELEMQRTQVQEQATELEMQAEELKSTIEQLQEQSALAEEARTTAEEATRRAEEANRAKSLFLTTMSHELRTPLNAIGGYVDLLALEIRGPLLDAQQEDLRRIKKSGQHLLSLINDILNLAKIESGQLDLHIRDVPLTSVFENVDTLVAPQFNTKGIRYAFPRCDPLLQVRADSDKLQQILLNVLSNACKFTDKGGLVAVECEADGAGASDGSALVAIIIRDTGRGIAEDKLEKIFEPFVQIDRHLHGCQPAGCWVGTRHLARSRAQHVRRSRRDE